MEYITAGIVTFNPNMERLINNISTITAQNLQIVVVDNFSKNIEDIKKRLSGISNVHIICNEKNKGIACALNQIMDYSDYHCSNWVLTLDQDSIISTDAVDIYKKAIESSDGRLAILAPNISDINLNNKGSDNSLDEYEEVKQCITSGSLTNVDTWKSVGKYDELMFIDWVDFDFCARVLKSGKFILKCNRVHLLHEIGRSELKKFLFWNVKVQNHSAFRKKYMAQNILYYAKKNGGFINRIKAYLRLGRLILLVLIYEDKKKEKMKSIFDGVVQSDKIYSKYLRSKTKSRVR